MDGVRGDLLPISLVAHAVFCPRRAWLEAAGERTDTWQMAEGAVAHGPADDPALSRPRTLRVVDVADPDLGVVGRCDLVELDDAGRATIIEYKATPVRRRPELTDAMRVQLALQARALRSAGREVVGAAVYFTNHRVRVPVELSERDTELAQVAVRTTREVIEARNAPAPLEDDPRCTSCSHASICLPDERGEGEVVRRIVVSDPDADVVHLTTPGSRASIRSGRLLVQLHGDELASIPLERVAAVVVHGNVDLSGGLTRELLWRGASVVWCTGSGRLVGWASSASMPNGAERVRQHRLPPPEGQISHASSWLPRSPTRRPFCDATGRSVTHFP